MSNLEYCCNISCRYHASGVHVDSAQLMFCSACRGVKYCSVECQRADWKSHKPLCRQLSAERTSQGVSTSQLRADAPEFRPDNTQPAQQNQHPVRQRDNSNGQRGRGRGRGRGTQQTKRNQQMERLIQRFSENEDGEYGLFNEYGENMFGYHAFDMYGNLLDKEDRDSFDIDELLMMDEYMQ